MRKLKLTLDALRVTTYELGPSNGPRGTVAAHNPPSQSYCGATYGWAEPSCDYTCPTSCDTLNTSQVPGCTAVTNPCGGCNGVE
jgi:hypothetical protein